MIISPRSCSFDVNHSEAAPNLPASRENRSRIEPEETVFFTLRWLMSVAKKDRVHVSKLRFQAVPQIAGRPPAVDHTDAKALDLNHLFYRQTTVDAMVIHIARDGLQRILLQVIEDRRSGPVSQMNHHIGVAAILLADRFEFDRLSD